MIRTTLTLAALLVAASAHGAPGVPKCLAEGNAVLRGEKPWQHYAKCLDADVSIDPPTLTPAGGGGDMVPLPFDKSSHPYAKPCESFGCKDELARFYEERQPIRTAKPPKVESFLVDESGSPHWVPTFVYSEDGLHSVGLLDGYEYRIESRKVRKSKPVEDKRACLTLTYPDGRTLRFSDPFCEGGRP